jgi:hypothetical protein
MLQNQERLRLYEFQGIQLVTRPNKGPLSLWGALVMVELSQLPLMERMCCDDWRKFK